MCLKKSERNILIFVVRLHYAVTVCNAFRVASERKDLVAIRFNFDTFPELERVLTELELDRECVFPSLPRVPAKQNIRASLMVV
jgi:hypothetical protein